MAIEDPIRLDFFGDELESIRAFDVETQRTTSTLKSVHLAPVSEVLMSDLAVGTFRKNYIAAFGGGVSKDPIYASVVEGIRPQGIEHYLPLFYPYLETIFDYAGADTLIAFDGLLSAIARFRLSGSILGLMTGQKLLRRYKPVIILLSSPPTRRTKWTSAGNSAAVFAQMSLKLSLIMSKASKPPRNAF